MIARYAIPFFLFMGVIVTPLLLWLLCRWLLPRKAAIRSTVVATLAVYGLLWYGFHTGFEQLEVQHVEYASKELPAAFDGYRILQFSDAHVGTFTGSRQWMLRRAVETINRQQADMIVFTGDLQNLRPSEIAVHRSLLRQLKARDGVYAVLGNHDYPMYLPLTEAEQADSLRLTKQLFRSLGWTLLLNEHRTVQRDSDSIVVAGMEDWGTAERMPHEGNVAKTLAGLPGGSEAAQRPFIVMLQHDPTCWREHILPESYAQLTLSGHTHGGQVALFGWSPVALNYTEWGGMTYEGSRAIYVSTGLGGLIPFRLGQPGEVAVITLKKPNI